MSDQEQPQLETLTREECLELLRRAVVGRIGYVADGPRAGLRIMKAGVCLSTV